MERGKFNAVVVTIIGICLFIFSFIYFINSQRFIKSSIIADGKIVDLIWQSSRGRHGGHYTCHPKASFTASDGKEYTFVSTLGSSIRSNFVGENVKILYPLGNPSKARIASFMDFWGIPLIAFGFGSISFGLGMRQNIFFARKLKLHKWLKENGQIIKADVQSIDPDIAYNRRPSYVIIAQWAQPASNSVYVFKSDTLGFNPQGYVKPGDKIKVIIDPGNPERYFVDTSFLPIIKN